MKQFIKNSFLRSQRAWGRARVALGTAPHPRDSFTVFLLHAVADIDSEMAVSTSRLREQMQALLDHGYRCLPWPDALRHLHAGTRPDEPSFVITFDDGYLNNLTAGVPLLDELNLFATVFVTTGLIDGTTAPPWRSDNPQLIAHYRRYRDSFRSMTWDDVRTLAASDRITVGSHTLTHPLVGTLDDETLSNELIQSRRILEDRIEQPVLDFSYPFGVRQYGAYSVRSEAVARTAAGYRCTFSAEVGRPNWTANEFLIPRIPLTNDDRGPDAIAKAAGVYDWVGIAQRTWQRIVPNPHASSRVEHANN